MSDVIVSSPEDALVETLNQMEIRHGEGFHLVKEVEPIEYEPLPDMVGYDFCLAPDARPKHYFTARLVTDAETGRIRYDVVSNYAQWLFKERAEGPYCKLLATDTAVIGYAARIFYARKDGILWREDQLNDYMGKGESNDPRVEVFAFFDEDVKRGDASRAITRLQAALWKLDGSMCLVAARRGADPRKEWIYMTPSSKQCRVSRGDVPTEKDVERVLKFHFGRDNEDLWDGTAIIGDPSDSSTLPEVTWK
ncbi:MAG: hypothetical protein IKF14_01545 [Atopobiaceae bacterium]|nr:hypothetical protein [Atopobiaceae bacterium]